MYVIAAAATIYYYYFLLSKGVMSTECQSTSDMYRIHAAMHSTEAKTDADVLFEKLIVQVYIDAR